MSLRRRHLIALIAVVAVCAIVGVVAWIVLRQVVGTTTMTVEAASPDGRAPDSRVLERTGQVLRMRLTAAGMDDASVTVHGDRTLVARVAGHQATDRLRGLTAPGELQVRKVLDQAPDDPQAGDASAAPSTGGTPTLEQVRAKLGTAYNIADALYTAMPITDDASQVLAPYASLSVEEVTVLPARMQYVVPFITCATLQARRPVAPPARGPAATCYQGAKYLLDGAQVLGSDVRKATATMDKVSGRWVVRASLTGGGQQKWTDLTREAAPNKTQVAVLIDAKLVSAPAIMAVIPGDLEISGSFEKPDVQTLAAQLNGGELPLRLTVLDIR